MKLFKNYRSKLDEMQEQNLRKLESWGYWLTWGALLLSMMIQMLISYTGRMRPSISRASG